MSSPTNVPSKQPHPEVRVRKLAPRVHPSRRPGAQGQGPDSRAPRRRSPPCRIFARRRRNCFLLKGTRVFKTLPSPWWAVSFFWDHVTSFTCKANEQSTSASVTWINFVYTNHKKTGRFLTQINPCWCWVSNLPASDQVLFWNFEATPTPTGFGHFHGFTRFAPCLNVFYSNPPGH